ncbi:potassium channel family protein [Lacticigenium naphthae]|uniref:potassium channel family protein n=1 Tax=Lacticigenium naphthae TaxID=515351 RepID=UPI0003FF624D|nr:potassium channel family protein [Lacticigenium naphthae]
MNLIKKYYDPLIILLALLSISLVILDTTNYISLVLSPYKELDILILIIFAIDYFTRLLLSRNKLNFIKRNVFDLVAIIPFSSFFYYFRIARIFRITRLSRLSRLNRFSKILRLTKIAAITGKASKHLKKFLKTNGFIYMIYTASTVLLIGASIYSITENTNFSDSLWWAFVTATTVGYGDISPSTTIGRITAVILMLTGIGLFGTLTSTITSFFMNDEDESIKEQNLEIKELNKKISYLLEKLDDKNF